MADKIKLVVAFLLVAAGITGFYVLHDSATAIRLAVLLLGLILAAALALTTMPGREFFAFGKEAVVEAKRVVWPTRKETVQTTGIVILFAVTKALFLWAVDASLLLVVNRLMGRSE